MTYGEPIATFSVSKEPLALTADERRDIDARSLIRLHRDLQNAAHAQRAVVNAEMDKLRRIASELQACRKNMAGMVY